MFILKMSLEKVLKQTSKKLYKTYAASSIDVSLHGMATDVIHGQTVPKLNII